jgi:hypothetical protein
MPGCSELRDAPNASLLGADIDQSFEGTSSSRSSFVRPIIDNLPEVKGEKIPE